MATKKTSKQALPNVPGAAMAQALGDAVFGKGGTVVVAAPCAKHAAVTGSGIGWQTWCPGCNATLHRDDGAPPDAVAFDLPGRPVAVAVSPKELCRYLLSKSWVTGDNWKGGDESTWMAPSTAPYAKVPGKRDHDLPGQLAFHIGGIADTMRCHPLDVVDAILAARHGASPPGNADATAAAILRLFAVAPDKGIAEDEVTRHLLALDLTSDVDAVSDRLLAMVTRDVLTIVHRGKPDTRKRGPLHYARGPAFPGAS